MIKGKQERQLSSAGKTIKGLLEALSQAADLGHRSWWSVFSCELCNFCSWAFFPLPPSLNSPQQMSAEFKQSVLWHTYNTAAPVPKPRYLLNQDQHIRRGRNRLQYLRTVLAWGIHHGANLTAFSFFWPTHPCGGLIHIRCSLYCPLYLSSKSELDLLKQMFFTIVQS